MEQLKRPQEKTDPTTLRTLPTELKGNVAEHLPITDVLSFRQASRDTYASSTGAFQDHFKELVHVFSRDGLNRLKEVTSQPGLIKRLESIQLLVINPIGLFDTEPDDNGEMERRVSAWRQELTELTKKDLDVDLLTSILSSLKASKKAVTFSIGSADEDDLKSGVAAGRANVMEILGVTKEQIVRRRTQFYENCSRAISSFFKAATSSEFALTGLDLCSTREGRFESDGLAGIDPSAFQKLSHSWETLKTLEMGFGNEDTRWFMAQDHGLKALISSASNITKLRLVHEGFVDRIAYGRRFPIFGDSNPFSWLDDAFAQHRLQHLELDRFCARVDQLARMLHRHRDSLKHLKLTTMRIPVDECWSEILRVVYADLDLNYVEFSNLKRDRNWYEGVEFPDEKRGFWSDKPMEIKAYLENMLKQPLTYEKNLPFVSGIDDSSDDD